MSDDVRPANERFYCAEFLRRWALQMDDAPTRALLANLAYAVANGQHVEAVLYGAIGPPRADVPSVSRLHGWEGGTL